MAQAVAKEKLPHSSNADCCALDNEVPAFMFRPISAPACELPSPPPADASFQSKDTDKIIHPDLKNDRSSLDDEVAFFMSPSDVPLPPRPPPIAKLGLGRKRRYSSVFSVNDEEEHLMPKRMRLMSCDVPVSSSPPPADASFQSKDTDKIMHPDFEYDCSSLDDELAFFTCPLPPRPPPIAELGLGRKRRYSSVFSVQDEEEHLMPKRMRLMTWDVSTSPAAEKNVCFPCPEDKRSDLLPLSSLQSHPPSQVNNNDTDQCTILLPPEIPVPPSPASVGDLETVDFPCLDN